MTPYKKVSESGKSSIDQIESLNREIKAREEAVLQATSEVKLLTTKLQDMEKEVADLAEELSEKDFRLVEVEQRSILADERLSFQEKEINEAKDALESKQRDLDDVEKNYKELQNECIKVQGKLSEKLKEITHQAQEMQKLKLDLEEVGKAHNMEVEKLKCDVSKLTMLLKEKDDCIGQQRMYLDELQTELENIKNKFSLQVSLTSAKLSEDELQSLSRIDEDEGSRGEDSLTSLKECLVQKDEELNSRSREIKKLWQEFLKQEQDLHELGAEKQQLETELEEVRALLKLSPTHEVRHPLWTEAYKQKSENSILEAEIEKLQKSLQEATKRIFQLQRESSTSQILKEYYQKVLHKAGINVRFPASPDHKRFCSLGNLSLNPSEMVSHSSNINNNKEECTFSSEEEECVPSPVLPPVPGSPRMMQLMSQELSSFGQSGNIYELKEEICVLVLRLEQIEQELKVNVEMDGSGDCCSAQRSETAALHQQLMASQDMCEILRQHLEELADFMEKVLHQDGNVWPDGKNLTPESIACIRQYLTESRELSQSLSQSLVIHDKTLLRQNFTLNGSSIQVQNVITKNVEKYESDSSSIREVPHNNDPAGSFASHQREPDKSPEGSTGRQMHELLWKVAVKNAGGDPACLNERPPNYKPSSYSKRNCAKEPRSLENKVMAADRVPGNKDGNIIVLEDSDSDNILLLLNDKGLPQNVYLCKNQDKRPDEQKQSQQSASKDLIWNQHSKECRNVLLNSYPKPIPTHGITAYRGMTHNDKGWPDPQTLTYNRSNSIPAAETTVNQNSTRPISWSSDTDIYSEPDRNVSLDRIGLKICTDCSTCESGCPSASCSKMTNKKMDSLYSSSEENVDSTKPGSRVPPCVRRLAEKKIWAELEKVEARLKAMETSVESVQSDILHHKEISWKLSHKLTDESQSHEGTLEAGMTSGKLVDQHMKTMTSLQDTLQESTEAAQQLRQVLESVLEGPTLKKRRHSLDDSKRSRKNPLTCDSLYKLKGQSKLALEREQELKDSLAMQETARRDAEEKMEEAQGEAELIRTEIDNCRTQLEEQQATLKQVQDWNLKLQKEFEGKDRRIKNADEKIANSEKEIFRLNNEMKLNLESLARVNMEKEELKKAAEFKQEELEQLKCYCKDLEAEIESANDSKARINELNAELLSAQEKCQQAKQEVDHWKMKNQALERDSEVVLERLNALQEESERWKAKIHDLQTEVESCQQRCETAEVSAKDWKSKFENVDKEAQQLKDVRECNLKMQKYVQDQEAQWKEQQTRLNEEIGRLEGLLQQDATRRRSSASSTESTQLREKLSKLQQDYAKIEEEANAIKQKKKEMEELNRSLQLELKVYEQVSSGKENIRSSRPEGVDSAVDRNGIDASLLLEMVSEMRQLRNELSQSIQVNSRLQKRLEQAGSKRTVHSSQGKKDLRGSSLSRTSSNTSVEIATTSSEHSSRSSGANKHTRTPCSRVGSSAGNHIGNAVSASAILEPNQRTNRGVAKKLRYGSSDSSDRSQHTLPFEGNTYSSTLTVNLGHPQFSKNKVYSTGSQDVRGNRLNKWSAVSSGSSSVSLGNLDRLHPGRSETALHRADSGFAWNGTSGSQERSSLTLNLRKADGEEVATRRPCYSSPDLGIESDPNRDGSFFVQDQPEATVEKDPFDCACLDGNQKLHAIGQLEEYELLKKEIEESIVTVRGVEARVKGRLGSLVNGGSPIKSIEYSTLKEISNSCMDLNLCLQESNRIISQFWIAPLCPQVKDGVLADFGFVLSENQNLQEELLRIKEQLNSKEKELNDTIDKLSVMKHKKEGMELAVSKQLTKTRKVLKKAKGNLEAEDSKRRLMKSSSMTLIVTPTSIVSTSSKE